MTRARRAGLALAVALGARGARAETPPYDYVNHVRLLSGPGLVPTRPGPRATWIVGAEFSRRPLRGALATGIGFAATTQLDGAWTAITPSLLVRYDVLYPFISGFWGSDPKGSVPLRLYAALRLGVDVSQSFRPAVVTPEPPYMLVRPVLQPGLDVEVPLPPTRTLVLVARAAFDAPVSLDDLWRWAFTFGLGWAWEKERP